jgi:4-amino-4-deoxy-L-arabinose transferase-like glycosyltransferase
VPAPFTGWASSWYVQGVRLEAGVLAPDAPDAAAALDAADVALDLVETRELAPDPRRRRLRIAAEAIGLLVAPVVAYFALQLRLMARPGAPDPAIHSGFVFDPGGIFSRYGTTLVSQGGLREAARVGFIVPARICYLLFGAVPGFAVFRYLLALVATIPVYILFRRLSGPGAGAFAALLVLVSPVIVTAWGTDYPDSASVSYLAAGTACLFVPASRRRRLLWVAASAGAFTLAVWSLIISLPLAVVAFAVYSVPRVRQQPADLVKKLCVAAAAAAVMSGLLALGSQVVVGRWDYFVPTISSSQFFSGASQLARRHSSSWHWLPYLDYLLVLPATAGCWLVARGRRIRRLRQPQTALGLVLVLEVAVFAYMQFDQSLWTLEDHYFSSLLWPAACLTLAAVAVDVAHRVFDNPRVSWVPAFAVVALEWGYEWGRKGWKWRFDWAWQGLVLAGVAVVVLGVVRTAHHGLRHRRGRLSAAVSAGGLTVVLAILLLLTVGIATRHPRLHGVVRYPVAAYGSALGQSDAALIDEYRVASELPSWVGPPQYPGEQMLMWWPHSRTGALYPIMGLYHAARNSFGQLTYPEITTGSGRYLKKVKPGEVLILDLSRTRVSTAVSSLRPFGGTVLRSRVFRSGPVSLVACLVELHRYAGAHDT